jgi:putative transposase
MGNGAHQEDAGQEVANVGQLIQTNERKIQAYLEEVVCSTVEEAMDALLDVEAYRSSRSECYGCSEGKGHVSRFLPTAAAHQGRQSQVEGSEVMNAAIWDVRHRTVPAERTLGGRSGGGDVSCRSERAASEDVTQAFGGRRVSPSTLTELNQKIDAQIKVWRNRPIEGNYP